MRTVVLEQRFSKNLQASYLDRTIDKAISQMDKLEGGAVPAATGALAHFNDLMHDFTDLGKAVGADFLVLGTLERLCTSRKTSATPYSDRGRQTQTMTTDAHIRIRVIKVSQGTVIGADSLNAKISDRFFGGQHSGHDQLSHLDRIGDQVADLVLDLVFPASIVETNPLIINRGSQNQVRPGDVFLIRRLGQEVREASGEPFAHLLHTIGKVEVTEAQANISLVRSIEGQKPQKGDLALPLKPKASSPKSAPVVGARPGGGPKLPVLAVGLVKVGSTAHSRPQAGEYFSIFTDTLISSLVQTRRFNLIDRQEVDQLLDEQTAQALTENRDLPSAMGALQGADYLLLGAVHALSIQDVKTELPNSNRVFNTREGRIQGNIRIVDARSGRILESRLVKVAKTLETQSSPQRLVRELADSFSQKVVAVLMSALYPVKVATMADNGVVYLNRGRDGGLRRGEVWQVLRPGKKIVDPDTGISLGTTETKIAEVKLTVVEDNRSQAALVSGSDIKADDLVKPLDQGPSADEAGRGGPAMAKGKPQGGKAVLALGALTLNARAKTSGSDMGPARLAQLTEELGDALNKSNRFRVLERQRLDQVLDEKAFRAVSQGQDIRPLLAGLAEADYLVLGEISNFYLSTQQSKVPYTNEIEITRHGVAEGLLRIVDVHTGELAASDKVRLKRNFSADESKARALTSLQDQYVQTAVAKIVATLYPIKVLGSGGDGTVYINRGRDAGLQLDDRFLVSRPGKLLKDPDTGVSFGRVEEKVGLLKITSVESLARQGPHAGPGRLSQSWRHLPSSARRKWRTGGQPGQTQTETGLVEVDSTGQTNIQIKRGKMMFVSFLGADKHAAGPRARLAGIILILALALLPACASTSGHQSVGGKGNKTASVYYAGYSHEFQNTKKQICGKSCQTLLDQYRVEDKKIRAEAPGQAEYADKVGLLNLMERGSVCLVLGQPDDSLRYLDSAQLVLEERDDESHAKQGAISVGSTAAELIGLGECGRYNPSGFEKVMLLNYKAMAYLLNGDAGRSYNVARRSMEWQAEERERFQKVLKESRNEAASQANTLAKQQKGGPLKKDHSSLKASSPTPISYRTKVMAAQRALQNAGYKLMVDGRMGSKTRAMLKDYQARRGLRPTGQIDEATMRVMGITGSSSQRAGGKPNRITTTCSRYSLRNSANTINCPWTCPALLSIHLGTTWTAWPRSSRACRKGRLPCGTMPAPPMKRACSSLPRARPCARRSPG